MNPQRETIRLAAVGDVHCTRTSSGALAPMFTEAASQADVLLLVGDLTDYPKRRACSRASSPE